MQQQTVPEPTPKRASLFAELDSGLRNGAPPAEPLDRERLFELNGERDRSFSLSSGSRSANRV